MSPYLCLLLGLLQPAIDDQDTPSILWVALRIHRDDERAFRKDPGQFLPQHCRGYEIVDETSLFEVVIHERETEAGTH